MNELGEYQAPPIDERRGLEFEVRCRDRKKRKVLAFETCSEYLVIHKQVNGSGWTVTQTITGYSMAQGLPSYEAARYAAGAMSQVFDLWQDRASDFVRRLYTLPPELWRWFLLWRIA